MCCGTSNAHGSWHRGAHHGGHHHAGSCGCGGFGHLGMCFSTRKEKVAWLEQHLQGLREEVKAVEERITELKKE